MPQPIDAAERRFDAGQFACAVVRRRLEVDIRRGLAEGHFLAPLQSIIDAVTDLPEGSSQVDAAGVENN